MRLYPRKLKILFVLLNSILQLQTGKKGEKCRDGCKAAHDQCWEIGNQTGADIGNKNGNEEAHAQQQQN